MTANTLPPDPPQVPAIEAGWAAQLRAEFQAPYFAALKHFLVQERARHRVYPRGGDILRAFQLTPFAEVRVVILGQDPYHGPGQAHGLAFSVRPGVRIPPSLLNIYKELESDLGIPRARHGFLEHWARQGVLLLNAVLTVEAGRAASHQGRGWERFTDAVIARVNGLPRPVVFMLWGSHAQRKAAFVDAGRHLVLRAPHPSPLSAHAGFFGCRHFSRANAFLVEHGEPPIDWQLPPA